MSAFDLTPDVIVLARMVYGSQRDAIELLERLTPQEFSGPNRQLFELLSRHLHVGFSFATLRPIVEAEGGECRDAFERLEGEEGTAAGLDGSSVDALVMSLHTWQRAENLKQALYDAISRLHEGAACDDILTAHLSRLEEIGAPSTPASGLTLLSSVDLETLPKPEWLIEPVLPNNAFVALVGPPKSFKSFLALDMACHIAAGIDWNDRPTRRGGVLYIYAEGVAGLQQRVAAWKTERGVAESTLSHLMFVPHRVIVDDKVAIKDVLRAVDDACAVPPSLIVIDTLARNMSGDESKTEDMSAFIHGCDALREATGATVLVVHHSGHSAEGRARGSSALPGAVDTQIQCTRDQDRIHVECKFQKDAAEFEIMAMEARPVGSSLVLYAVGLASGQLQGNKRTCLAVLHEQFAETGSTHKSWSNATELSNSSFNNALKWLKANNYVEAKRGNYRVTEQGRVALGPKSNSTPASRVAVGSSPVQPTGVC